MSGNTARLRRPSVAIPVAALLGLLASACSAPPATPGVRGATGPASGQGQRAGPAAVLARGDLEIVDCLLPGQVRQLGAGATYLTARRPTRTTTSDCRLRGGEYVAWDRASLESALAVWRPAADSGDPEAQVNVGELYERGVGGAAPDYAQAAGWYEKAGAQGNARALYNLGTLYEQGQGVPQDRLRALNLYREAWGLPEDSLVFQSVAAAAQAELRQALEAQLAERNAQIGTLQRQLQQLQEELARRPADRQVEAAREIDGLKALIARLEGERQVSTERLAGVVSLRSPSATAASGAQGQPARPAERRAGELNFGRYYALVIGNQHYRAVDSLQTPISDAQRAARVLADKYGFSVQVIEDASDVTMLKALNDLNGMLAPDDNVLIYYAGHGYRLQNRSVESGYWLPVNADAPPQDTFWIPNEQVTAHLARLPARRVLVVADSCYAGLLSTDPGYLFGNGAVGYSDDYIRFKLPKRSRLLLSSGGDRPVLDAGGEGNSAGNSVFARAFLEELEANDGILPVPELYTRIRGRVEAVAKRNTFVQVPQFKSIKGAGHEVGDFFFVPKARQAAAAGD